ncbi:MAG: helix-turn-helix domain-containing protein [Clostridiales bacterium]|nr:helix-turn-helix domain-containing protein [Clostridiales bacterium]
MDTQEIIFRVGYIRNRANLSARALSLNIGKTDSYINRMEQNGFIPSLPVLLEIIDACNSTPEEFFYHDIQRYRADKDGLTFIGSLSEKQLKAIRNLYN